MQIITYIKYISLILFINFGIRMQTCYLLGILCCFLLLLLFVVSLIFPIQCTLNNSIASFGNLKTFASITTNVTHMVRVIGAFNKTITSDHVDFQLSIIPYNAINNIIIL